MIVSNGFNGVMVTATTATIITNNVVNENLYHGIKIQDTDGAIISSNSCKDNDFNDTATYDGVNITKTIFGNPTYNIIVGNRCENNDRYEINIEGDRNVVDSNNCYGTDHTGAINDGGTNTLLGDNLVA